MKRVLLFLFVSAVLLAEGPALPGRFLPAPPGTIRTAGDRVVTGSGGLPTPPAGGGAHAGMKSKQP